MDHMSGFSANDLQNRSDSDDMPKEEIARLLHGQYEGIPRVVFDPTGCFKKIGHIDVDMPWSWT